MGHGTSRRTLLRGAAAWGLGGAVAYPLILPATARGANERLNIGVVAVAGQGGANLNGCTGENIAALCDIDRNHLAAAAQRFPKAFLCEDYRALVERKDIDAVVCSTPDHTHAFVSLAAMRAGKDVYCEKPLAHSVWEVRQMRQEAARLKRVTQMGTQIHAGDNYRRVVEIIKSGAIGQVHRVRVWCNRTNPGGVRVKEGMPPAHVNYDQWIGPAPMRPYHVSHFHFVWRWWWDFGGGQLADMGCHYIDLAHWALDLTLAESATANGKVTTQGDNSVPTTLQVDYRYPARGLQPPVHLTWGHGIGGPLDEAGRPETFAGFDSGVSFEGDKGQLLADYGKYKLLPEKFFMDYKPPEPTIARSIGHHREWLEAIKTRGKTTCNFDYSGALAETVLWGNVAYRSCPGETLAWDNQTLKPRNRSDAAQFVRREYRKGWVI